MAQQRLWFLAQLDATDPAYNLSQGIKLTGRLNIPALKQSLTELVNRHSALRTCFSVQNGQAVQKIAPAADVSLVRVDFRTVPEPEQNLHQRVAEEGRRPFDLTQSPLLRPVLFSLGDTEHLLLVTFHHIAVDAWSIRIFLEELSALYDCFSQGKTPTLPPVPLQYADYAAWEREHLQVEASDVNFWKERLAGVPALLELPADRPRPGLQSSRGARQPIGLSHELTEALQRLGTQQNATLDVILLAAFQTLLYRYTGQPDLVIGSPVANRTRAELEPVFGLFANMLALRTDLSGEPGFLEALARTHQTVLAAHAHQEVPFEKLLEALRPKRDRSYHPIFQVLFAVHPPLPPNRMAGGVNWQPCEIDLGTSRFDLTLELTPTETGVAGWLEYSSALFDPGRMERMARNFETLLAAVVAHPEQSIGRVPLLSRSELCLLEEWKQTARNDAASFGLTQLFAQQVAARPQATALVCGEQRLTYEQLNHRANVLAQELRRLGVGPDVLVGLCVERSPEMVVGMLGILKAGGAYVPMDPAYPAERLEFMLQDSKASVLVTQEALQAVLPRGAAHILCLDRFGSPEMLASTAAEDPAPQPEHLAYVIYTSGSTGRPKGVAVEHRSVAALLAWARHNFADEELAGILTTTSICFDVSVFEIFVPLCWGGKLLIAQNPLEWTRQSMAGEVTLVSAVPSLVTEWVRARELPGSIRTVNLAGEPLNQALVEKIYQTYPHVQRVNDLYGPTEATVYCTHAERKAGGRANIGRPLSTACVYVLDPAGQKVPIGVPGELHVGGLCLARGYLHQPELTAQKFIADPFVPGARIYRTGDLVRFLEDGTIEYLGRTDHQVKIRGFRIELGEIEEQLRRHPAIREAVLMAREDHTGEKLLVAYVAPHALPPPEPGELRGFLKQKLPEFMVPARFVFLQALPVTPNGKVDRKALPAPNLLQPTDKKAGVPPRTDTEKLLAKIWSEVLGVPQVGVEDNFFELGGHSLMMTQMLSRIREALEVDLPIRVVFEYPTVAGMAEVVENILITEIEQLSEEEVQALEAALASECRSPTVLQ